MMIKVFLTGRGQDNAWLLVSRFSFKLFGRLTSCFAVVEHPEKLSLNVYFSKLWQYIATFTKTEVTLRSRFRVKTFRQKILFFFGPIYWNYGLLVSTKSFLLFEMRLYPRLHFSPSLSLEGRSDSSVVFLHQKFRACGNWLSIYARWSFNCTF